MSIACLLKIEMRNETAHHRSYAMPILSRLSPSSDINFGQLPRLEALEDSTWPGMNPLSDA
jgi:hypothetical protein